METTNREVTAEQKESAAITVMRCMLINLAEEKQISFEDAMINFSKSDTYNDLFDFETEIWKEGPDYLRSLYDDEMSIH